MLTRSQPFLSALFACALIFSGLFVAPRPAQAAIAGANILVVHEGVMTRSASVQSVAIVTNRTTGLSTIDMFFLTSAGTQIGLKLESADQRRVEAMYQHLLSAFDGRTVQITGYATTRTAPNRYTVNLDTNLLYVVIST